METLSGLPASARRHKGASSALPAWYCGRVTASIWITLSLTDRWRLGDLYWEVFHHIGISITVAVYTDDWFDSLLGM